MKNIISSILLILVFLSPMSAREYNDLSNRYKWIGVFVKDTNKNQQILKSTDGFYDFKDEIKLLWNSGYILDDIKYGNGKWIGVFSKNIDNKSQKYHETGRWTDMHDVISKEWKKGFYLTKID